MTEAAGQENEALKGTGAEEPIRIAVIPAFSATAPSRKSPIKREQAQLVSISFAIITNFTVRLNGFAKGKAQSFAYGSFKEYINCPLSRATGQRLSNG
jgi:hypothetical protein